MKFALHILDVTHIESSSNTLLSDADNEGY